MTIHMHALAAAAAATLLATAAPARANVNELAIGTGSRSLRSDSANAVTADNLDGGELGYARALKLGYHEVRVWATASFGWAGATGTMFQTLATKLDEQSLGVGVRARYRLHPRVAVSGRVALGTTHAALELTQAGRRLSDGGWGATTTAALGLELTAITTPRFKLGARFEYGYVAAQGVELAPREEMTSTDANVIMLPAIDASLGKLDLGGRFFTVSLVSQF